MNYQQTHYHSVGLYNDFAVRMPDTHFSFVHDDFGNLVSLDWDQFCTNLYIATGVMV